MLPDVQGFLEEAGVRADDPLLPRNLGEKRLRGYRAMGYELHDASHTEGPAEEITSLNTTAMLSRPSTLIRPDFGARRCHGK